MKKIKAPIALREKGDHIANLHEALIQLEFSIDNNTELKNKQFGEVTQSAVKRFQMAEKIPASGIVDTVTAFHLNSLLFPNEETVFEINGTVYDVYEKPQANEKVVAYDVDLKGAAVYSTIKSQIEIDENGGFEILGEAQTDKNGKYIIKFGTADFQLAERDLADVIVYAIEDLPGAGSNGSIVGRSRLVYKKEYDRRKRVDDLHIRLSGDTYRANTEYEDLIGVVMPFLAESEVLLHEMADSEQQISFLAEEVNREESKIHALIIAADLSNKFRDLDLNQELLYALGSHKIPLNAFSLASTSISVLKRTLIQAMKTFVIAQYENDEIDTFCIQLHQLMVREALDISREDIGAQPRQFFNIVLSGREDLMERLLSDFVNHEGTQDAFWKDIESHPIFEKEPELLGQLESVGQLALLTGYHLPLVEDLWNASNEFDVMPLIEMEIQDWIKRLDRVGWPTRIESDDNAELEEQKEEYTRSIRKKLQATYPTLKVAQMLNSKTLTLRKPELGSLVSQFLNEERKFDFRNSIVMEFKEQISEMAGEETDAIVEELKRVQRIFQLSPTPEIMSVLSESGLHSATQIGRMPKLSFISQFGASFGEENALKVYERASYMQTRNNVTATKFYEIANGVTPGLMWDQKKKEEAQKLIENYIPNWETLFGRFDICECEHCRSVFSPAAYLVDILQFLKDSTLNQDIPKKNPLDILSKRRTDIAHLQLTCENTHTVIPYIDLVNEIMEYYVVHDKLDPATAHDTDGAGTEELQAEPQYTLIGAYDKLAESIYPFSLPYHQPLDIINSYLEHQNTGLSNLVDQFGDDQTPAFPAFKTAMTLKMSPKQYEVITEQAIEGNSTAIPLWECYGYTSELVSKLVEGINVTKPWNEWLMEVPELLKRTGLSYKELVVLIKARLINPYPEYLAYLQNILEHTQYSSQEYYNILDQLSSGSQPLNNFPELIQAIGEEDINEEDFMGWLNTNFEVFKDSITLFEPDSSCDLKTTSLKSIQAIYDISVTTGIENDKLSLLHRFVRLQRNLDWKIEDLDMIIHSLGKETIDSELLNFLADIQSIQEHVKLSLDEIVVLWGSIDFFKEKSLYKKLFLNKSILQIDPVFEFNIEGQILVGVQTINEHITVIQSALRLSANDIQLISEDTSFNMEVDTLTLPFLSVLYRYKLLSKALKIKIKDFINLKNIFQVNPFSSWDENTEGYIGIFPEQTLEFITLVKAIQESDFDLDTFSYLFLPGHESKIQPDLKTVSNLVLLNHQGLLQIDKDHLADVLVDEDLLSKELALLFEESVVIDILNLIKGNSMNTTIITSNLDIEIPESIADKLSYQKATGILSFIGIMTTDEKNILLGELSSTLSDAIEDLYQQPETFIKDALYGVFSTNLTEAVQLLLNRPEVQNPPIEQEKLNWFYQFYLPFLKLRLKQDIIIQGISGELAMKETDVKSLIGNEMRGLTEQLSIQGLSAIYYSDTNFTTAVLERIDEQVDFNWADASPNPLIPNENFSVRWEGWLIPYDGEPHTFIFNVADVDDLLKVWINDELILDRQPNQALELEAISSQLLKPGNASHIRIDYMPNSQLAGLQVSWKTPTRRKTKIDKQHFFPIENVKGFQNAFLGYYKAGLFIKNFDLQTEEIAHFIQYPEDFDLLDLINPTFIHWKRLNDYAILRSSLHVHSEELLKIFKSGHLNIVGIDLFLDQIKEVTGFNREEIEKWWNTNNLTQGDFVNEKVMTLLYQGLKTVDKLGVKIEQLTSWVSVNTTFQSLFDISQEVKQIVKMKYDTSTWLEVAPTLNDPIRNRQQKALIAYLLMQESLQEWGVYDADGLFEYFLIDVQMDACMDTSRVKQSISSIQLFIQRCLLNLESNYNDQNDELGVSPNAIDTNRWTWMKNYRVWEANRKVFLYPENWLEPEWRDDKSPFFKEMESELMENDMTLESTEKAYRTYLSKMEIIAKMDLVGQYYDSGTKLLHVVGRTRSMPYQYYYRKQNIKYNIWSAWEKIDLDIKGEPDGVHVVPVVWQNKLFIFWLQLVAIEKATTTSKSMYEMGNYTKSELEGTKRWDILLARSEYKDGSWEPVKVFPQKMDLNFSGISVIDITTRQFSYGSQGEKELLIAIKGGHEESKVFRLKNLYDRPRIYKDNFIAFKSQNSFGGKNSFMKKQGLYSLVFQNKIYLMDYNNPENDFLKDFELLSSHQYADFEKKLQVPLFFQDNSSLFILRDKPKINIYTFEDHMGLKGMVSGSLNSKLMTNIELDPLLLNTRIEIENKKSLEVKYSVRKNKQYSKSLNESNSSLFTQEKSQVENAFSANSIYDASHLDGSLQFDIFYHPYISQLTGALNKGGVEALFNKQLTLPDDEGQFFKENYSPTNLVNKVYPRINLDFRREGSYALYNWELYYHTPLMIAMHLSKNNKFKEAQQWFHYLFNPTTNEAPDPNHPEDRYWKFSYFRNILTEDLEDFFKSLKSNTPVTVIDEWRDNPFRPHQVARHRPIAYMKKVVIAYLDNLFAWGDQLFRRDTMESINEATQFYVQAGHILGSRPQFVPQRGKTNPETYATLSPKLDAFSNAHVELENLFPYSSEVNISTTSEAESLLGVGNSLYFCIPSNESLLEYWDTVADRLFKIRNCMNIDGTKRQLALFEPPIDPGALVKALAGGLSIDSVLSDLNGPSPLYRFFYTLQKSFELTQEVKNLGSALLSAIEKKEGEHLTIMRAEHEIALHSQIVEVREKQIEEAESQIEVLQKAWDTAQVKYDYYESLLSIETPQNLALGRSGLPIEFTSEVFDLETSEITGSDIIGGESSQLVLAKREKLELNKLSDAYDDMEAAEDWEMVANGLLYVPKIEAEALPWGLGIASEIIDGLKLGEAAKAVASSNRDSSEEATYEATRALKIAQYLRRQQDWTTSFNQAGHELVYIASQIHAASLRSQVVKKELNVVEKQIEQAEVVYTYLQEKFSNKELYNWMKQQLFSTYKSFYNLAYEMAKQAEKAFRFEFGEDNTNFIQYGYWNSSQEGLLAGESLHLSLKRMEKAYQERNKREYEITKHIPISFISPDALLKLKETGVCEFNIPELLFDIDFPGQYFRRIKSVSITIPCIVGPYTSVSAKLTLLKNRVRKNGNSQSEYAYTGLEDPNFIHDLVGMQSVATSQAQGDNGMFELNFRDERYLPFEGAGAISRWKLELPTEFHSFDYDSISDVIMHVNYTAREGGDALKQTVNIHVNDSLNKWMNELSEEGTGLLRLMSMKQEFSREWHRFSEPKAIGEGENEKDVHQLSFEIKPQHFPYFLRGKELGLTNVKLILKLKDVEDNSIVINMPVTLKKGAGESVDIIAPLTENGLQTGIANLPSLSYDLDEDIFGWWQVEMDNADIPEELKIIQSNNNATPAFLNQKKIEDMYLIFNYMIG